MKVEIWYKSPGYPSPQLIQSSSVEVVNERPGTQSKNGYHLVSTGTDLPKPSVPEVPAPGQVVPKTLLELYNLLFCLNNFQTGKVVGQLLVSECATSGQSQFLLQHLGTLAVESGKLLPTIRKILDGMPHQATGVIFEKK